MPVALLLDIVNAIASVAPQLPEVVALVSSAAAIAKAGTVTADQAAAIRAQLDAVKALIDDA